MAENREVLLKQEERVYYEENCPGCKVEKLKNSNLGVPFKHLFYCFLVVLAAGTFCLILFVFFYNFSFFWGLRLCSLIVLKFVKEGFSGRQLRYPPRFFNGESDNQCVGCEEAIT